MRCAEKAETILCCLKKWYQHGIHTFTVPHGALGTRTAAKGSISLSSDTVLAKN